MIYLDQAATSWPKPAEVAAEIARAATELTANAGRGSHRGAIDSARLVFDTRSRLAACFGIAASENLVFTRGCTESLNLVLKGWLRAGDRVLVSPLEHNSVMRPLTRLVQQYGVVVNTLPADPLGRLDLAGVERAVAESPPALVVAAHASNVNGVVQDWPPCRAIGAAPLLIDAAQTAGVLPIDVRCPHLDFLACSLHKGLLGPTGVGLCYLAPGRDLRRSWKEEPAAVRNRSTSPSFGPIVMKREPSTCTGLPACGGPCWAWTAAAGWEPTSRNCAGGSSTDCGRLVACGWFRPPMELPCA